MTEYTREGLELQSDERDLLRYLILYHEDKIPRLSFGPAMAYFLPGSRKWTVAEADRALIKVNNETFKDVVQPPAYYTSSELKLIQSFRNEQPPVKLVEGMKKLHRDSGRDDEYVTEASLAWLAEHLDQHTAIFWHTTARDLLLQRYHERIGSTERRYSNKQLWEIMKENDEDKENRVKQISTESVVQCLMDYIFHEKGGLQTHKEAMAYYNSQFDEERREEGEARPSTDPDPPAEAWMEGKAVEAFEDGFFRKMRFTHVVPRGVLLNRLLYAEEVQENRKDRSQSTTSDSDDSTEDGM